MHHSSGSNVSILFASIEIMADRRSRSRSPPATVAPWRRNQVPIDGRSRPSGNVRIEMRGGQRIYVIRPPRLPSGRADRAEPSVETEPSGASAPAERIYSCCEPEAEDDIDLRMSPLRRTASMPYGSAGSMPSGSSGSAGSPGDVQPSGELPPGSLPSVPYPHFQRWLWGRLSTLEAENERLRTLLRQANVQIEVLRMRPPPREQ